MDRAGQGCASQARGQLVCSITPFGWPCSVQKGVLGALMGGRERKTNCAHSHIMRRHGLWRLKPRCRSPSPRRLSPAQKRSQTRDNGQRTHRRARAFLEGKFLLRSRLVVGGFRRLRLCVLALGHLLMRFCLGLHMLRCRRRGGLILHRRLLRSGLRARLRQCGNRQSHRSHQRQNETRFHAHFLLQFCHVAGRRKRFAGDAEGRPEPSILNVR